MPKCRIYALPAFDEWCEEQNYKSKRQIKNRLSLIENEGYFGNSKDLNRNNDGLQELKFNDGRRIYYIVIPVDQFVLLLGGNKNGQDKDIKKARGLIEKAKNKRL